ncbi:hypothetical protein D7316_03768 [Gordonia insulae]|uniref:Uncharacterized protein n=1 Tax=Gordonia insulae TaxID=2420509 RepID=A0A3G8JSK8_9ACTN|nr:hypothetical protein D7316_03768 [Gordonia insulae]
MARRKDNRAECDGSGDEGKAQNAAEFATAANDSPPYATTAGHDATGAATTAGVHRSSASTTTDRRLS